MLRLDQVRVRLLLCLVMVGSLVGCGGVVAVQQSVSNPSQGSPAVAGYPGPALSGRVLAGGSAVQGAAVQIYAAGTAGNGSAPTQLLTAAQTTDTSGGFEVAAGGYDCPAADSVIYAVARGGSTPGAPANASLVLFNVFGSCSSAGAHSVLLNEQTTVATAFALRPFLSAGGVMGASATNAAGLHMAVATSQRLVDPVTGAVPASSFAANATAPIAKLNSLANMLHGCAVSAPACGSLFAQVAKQVPLPTNTLDAALGIANHPGLTLPVSSTAAFFQPALLSAPADWTLGVAIAGGGLHGPTSVAIDGTGLVWVTNYYGAVSVFSTAGSPVYPAGITGFNLQASFAGALDAANRFWVTNEQNDDYTLNSGNGSLSVLTRGGVSSPAAMTIGTGGLNAPTSIAFDRAGRAWVVDYGNSHLTVLNGDGVPQSGAAGYTSDQLGFPVAVAVDSRGQAWVANQSASTVTRVSADGSTFTSYTVGSSPAAVAVDAADNIWTANFYADSVGLVGAEGVVHSGAGFSGGGLLRPTGIAVDGAGRVWVANYRAAGVTELEGTAGQSPGQALSGANGWGADLDATEAFGIAIDAAGDVWLSSYGDNRVLELIGAATPVKTPLLGGVRLP